MESCTACGGGRLSHTEADQENIASQIAATSSCCLAGFYNRHIRMRRKNVFALFIGGWGRWESIEVDGVLLVEAATTACNSPQTLKPKRKPTPSLLVVVVHGISATTTNREKKSAYLLEGCSSTSQQRIPDAEAELGAVAEPAGR